MKAKFWHELKEFLNILLQKLMFFCFLYFNSDNTFLIQMASHNLFNQSQTELTGMLFIVSSFSLTLCFTKSMSTSKDLFMIVWMIGSKFFWVLFLKYLRTSFEFWLIATSTISSMKIGSLNVRSQPLSSMTSSGVVYWKKVFSTWIMISTIKPMYNAHLQYPKFVVVNDSGKRNWMVNTFVRRYFTLLPIHL